MKELDKVIEDLKAEIKADTDAEMMRLYSEHGVTESAIMVDGVRVGMRKIIMTKPAFRIYDEQAFIEFATDNGLDGLTQLIIKPADNYAEFLTVGADGLPYLLDSNAVVPGVVFEPARPRCVQVKGCDPETVAAAMHIELQDGRGVFGLLAEGANDVNR